MMRRFWVFVVAFLALVLCSSHNFIASAERYRVSEERQRQLQESKGRVHCSRSRSRSARSIISEYLMPFVEAEKYSIPKSCRLHPDNDIYREQEGNMEELRPMQWQCRQCKKLFRTQAYLDMHFDNRHSQNLDTSPNRCLADTCGALHCDHFDSLSSSKPKAQATCKPAVAEKNRHACEVLANICFPAEKSQATKELNDFFKRQFCDAHTCKKKLKIYPRGSGIDRNKSLIYALSFFTIVVLALFYLVVYLHKRESGRLIKGLQRATSRPSFKGSKVGKD